MHAATPPVLDAFFTVTEPGSRETGFAIRGGHVAPFDWGAGRMAGGARPLERQWSALPAAFRTGFDAAMGTADPWTMVFRGPQCLLLNPLEGSVAEVTTIAARLPGLPQPFPQGIDAALAGGPGNEVYLFADGQCVRYDLRAMTVLETAPLERIWSGLAAHAPEFTAGIDAAVRHPSRGTFHFFRGGAFTRGTLATRTVTDAARLVDDTTWPGLVPTFAPGFAYVQVGREIDVLGLDGDQVVQTLDIEAHSDSASALQMSPDGRLLYVYHHLRRVCVDTATRDIVAESDYSGEERPQSGVCFSTDGSLVHGATSTGSHDRVFLDTFRAGTTQRTQRVELRAGDLFAALREPFGAGETAGSSIRVDFAPPVASADGRYVYVGTGLDGRGVAVEVDVQAGRMRQAFRIPDGSEVRAVALSPDGHHLHVGGSGVVTFDVRNGTVVRQGVLPQCTALAVQPGGDALYCLPWYDAKEGVLVADPLTHTVRRRIPVGGSGGPGTPHAIAFDYGGTVAYVSDEHACAVAVVDTDAHDMVRAIPMRDGRRPMSIAVGPY
jgi:6-phosphogluconolactonase (cycloisomerase 2 family)